jgi:hypothetical protein
MLKIIFVSEFWFFKIIVNLGNLLVKIEKAVSFHFSQKRVNVVKGVT